MNTQENGPKTILSRVDSKGHKTYPAQLDIVLFFILAGIGAGVVLLIKLVTGKLT
ncbi:MAG: hypothetical protein WCH99_08300 [Verrucomicrobiota bacterium]